MSDERKNLKLRQMLAGFIAAGVKDAQDSGKRINADVVDDLLKQWEEMVEDYGSDLLVQWADRLAGKLRQ